MPRPTTKKTRQARPSRAAKRTGTSRRAAGGAATAGGLIFQAAVTAIALVKLASGRPLGWLDGVAQDVPVLVLAETGGSGDDLQARLRDGGIAEI